MFGRKQTHKNGLLHSKDYVLRSLANRRENHLIYNTNTAGNGWKMVGKSVGNAGGSGKLWKMEKGQEKWAKRTTSRELGLTI